MAESKKGNNLVNIFTEVLDPSYKTGLDFRGWFLGENPILWPTDLDV